MTTTELITACRKSLKSVLATRALEKAIGLLEQGEAAKIDRSGTSRSAEHYRSVYEQRFAHCQATGNTPLGILESLQAFKALSSEAQLISIAVEQKNGGALFFWIDHSDNVIACIVIDPPL